MAYNILLNSLGLPCKYYSLTAYMIHLCMSRYCLCWGLSLSSLRFFLCGCFVITAQDFPTSYSLLSCSFCFFLCGCVITAQDFPDHCSWLPTLSVQDVLVSLRGTAPFWFVHIISACLDGVVAAALNVLSWHVRFVSAGLNHCCYRCSELSCPLLARLLSLPV